MESLFQDLKHALRMLRRNPGFAVVVMLTIALGIGANTAIFSVAYSVLLRPLPYGDPDRLVLLSTTSSNFGPGVSPISYPNFLAYREQNTVLEAVGVSRGVSLSLLSGEQAERVDGARVSANMLRLLGLQPFLGRDFLDAEEKPGAAPVVLLGHGLWLRRFGGDAAVVGTTIGLDGQSYQIVGILPPGIAFPAPTTELWIPLVPGQPESVRGNYFLRAIGRLKSGIGLQQADAQTKTIAARLAKEYPDANQGISMELLSLHEATVGNVRLALWILLGAVGMVLLVACGNIANLLLSRAAGRATELAIRSSLGAGRSRLLRQLLTESLLVSLAGAGLGLALAAVGVPVLVRLGNGAIPRAAEIRLDAVVLGFTAALAVLTALAFGLAPALSLTRGDTADSLREAGRRGGSRGRGYRRALGALVATEVALSMVLLAGAGLLLRSLWRLQEVPSGFAPQGLITYQMGAATTKYPGIPQQAEYYRRVTERLATVPGVDSVAAVHRLPLYRFPTTTDFQIEGRPVAQGAVSPSADVRIITPGYFHTMRIPLLEGRELGERDDATAPKVVVVSRALAEKFWPGVSPLGERLQIGADLTDRWEVVGVVGDVRLRGLDQGAGPALYWTTYQNFFPAALRSVSLVVRAKGDPASVSGAIGRAIAAVDPGEGLASPRSMDDVLADSYSQRSLNLALMLIFAGIASALAAIGLYGVMSYSVSQRTQEIGIRMALGADTGTVLRMIMRHGVLLVLLGLAVGLAATIVLTRLLASLLFQVSATDPATLAGVVFLLAAVALLAAYLPARRATRIDPLIALRHE